MLQGLQHGQRVLVGAAIIRSGEGDNAELDRHLRYSVTGLTLLAEPIRQGRVR